MLSGNVWVARLLVALQKCFAVCLGLFSPGLGDKFPGRQQALSIASWVFCMLEECFYVNLQFWKSARKCHPPQCRLGVYWLPCEAGPGTLTWHDSCSTGQQPPLSKSSLPLCSCVPVVRLTAPFWCFHLGRWGSVCTVFAGGATELKASCQHVISGCMKSGHLPGWASEVSKGLIPGDLGASLPLTCSKIKVPLKKKALLGKISQLTDGWQVLSTCSPMQKMPDLHLRPFWPILLNQLCKKCLLPASLPTTTEISSLRLA